jgi:hypothetical protein
MGFCCLGYVSKILRNDSLLRLALCRLKCKQTLYGLGLEYGELL